MAHSVSMTTILDSKLSVAVSAQITEDTSVTTATMMTIKE
jgi:hypothetical protein